MAMIALLAGMQMVNGKPANLPVFGRPAVVDGDTLRFGGQRVRLMGIDAPELGQFCQDGDGANWACGDVARTEMSNLLSTGDLRCEGAGHDRYGRLLARCEAAGTDLGHAMVSDGLAVSDGDYFGDEAQARFGRKGIWIGSFTPPAEYRRRQNGGSDPGPDLLEMIRDWFR